jgi:hypothetical protein
VVVADRAHARQRSLVRHAHVVQELHRHHRAGLGVVVAVHRVADVVQVAGDRRQLGIALG